MKFARKSDIIIIACLVAAGLLSMLLYNTVFGKSGAYAEIYYESKLVKTVKMTEGKDEDFSLPQVPKVVFHLFTDGSIAFVESDCPDKVCIKSGHLHLVGQFAACLPNQLYMKIVAADPADTGAPDIIIG